MQFSQQYRRKLVVAPDGVEDAAEVSLGGHHDVFDLFGEGFLVVKERDGVYVGGVVRRVGEVAHNLGGGGGARGADLVAACDGELDGIFADGGGATEDDDIVVGAGCRVRRLELRVWLLGFRSWMDRFRFWRHGLKV